jgi:hypothetical protein
VKTFKEKKRERFLNRDELRRLGEALRIEEEFAPSAVVCIRLLLLTGCRLGKYDIFGIKRLIRTFMCARGNWRFQMRRSVFSREFKRESVQLMMYRDVLIVLPRRELDLDHNVLRRWLKELGAYAEPPFRAVGN